MNNGKTVKIPETLEGSYPCTDDWPSITPWVDVSFVLSGDHPWEINERIKALEARIAELESKNKDPRAAKMLMQRVFGPDRDW